MSSCATLLNRHALHFSNGVYKLLMSWLGHRESEMIRHYYHLRNSESKRQMGLLPSLDNTNSEAGS